ncbi:SH3 domain-containing protein [Cellulophaga baltica]|uniref:SH3b domain-containing protein n=1 Tax=Cellulophaga baltica 18 TaxID=1348584 RepID=A0AAU8RJ84_9FLAO|nr:SH3 domain-containing protein [Cellulophaga baltica]AIZ43347.1 hypothetical protein M666_18395 [Cellulophaga baltica 18]
MKNLAYFIVLVIFFNCRNNDKSNSNLKTIIEKENIENAGKYNSKNIVEKFVSAKSGLNYRKKPKGEIIGKLSYGQKIQIVEYCNIFQKIKDNDKTISGEWLGVTIDNDTVIKYVFGGFLSEKIELTDFYKFTPKKISDININNFRAEYLYYTQGNYVAVGHFTNEKITEFTKDYGQRLLFLDDKKNINFKSKGVGDLYLYKPYFYKNNQNEDIIVVCLKSYEYFFGGEVFLIKDKKIKYLGNLDIEPNDMEKSLIDILTIKEIDNKKTFLFNSDSLLLKPGSEDILILNNNVKYEYFNGKFELKK